MGLPRLVRLSLIFSLSFLPLGAEENHQFHHILFLLKKGQIERALSLYEESLDEAVIPDYSLIQDLGLLLLEQGLKQPSEETQRMALFGASMAMNEKAIDLLESALIHSNPEVQGIALLLLGQFPREDRLHILRPLLHSTNILLRLEALLMLAKEKNPAFIAHAETLMNKLPSPLHALFPPLFAMVGTPEATKFLRRFFTHRNEGVRIAALLSATEWNRDDLLPDILKLCRSPNPDQQEVCAMALSQFHDSTVVPILQELSHASEPLVKLAAHYALYSQGMREYRLFLFEEGDKGNPFAVALLGHVEGSEEILAHLLDHHDPLVALNAALSLLKRKDPRCLSAIAEILLLGRRDWMIIPHTSHSGSLKIWKPVPIPRDGSEIEKIAEERGIQIREEILEQAIHFSEPEFLALARLILQKQQNDLVPSTISLVERLGTPGAVRLLKEEQERLGAPLIRNYCNLALYRLQEEGPYRAQLIECVRSMYHESLIQFRPFLPLPEREMKETYLLTPKEKSRLLVEAFEALAKTQEADGIGLLLEAIRKGHPDNRYALAGLLMRATQ